MRAQRFGLLLIGFWLAGSTAWADEKSELVAKQKTLVEETLKKLELEKSPIVETDDLLVTGSIAEDKLKPLAALAQKYYAAAYKALKFEQGDSTPKGKFALFVFPERRVYAAFFRTRERTVEKDEQSHAEPRAENPYVAVTMPLGDSKANIEAEAGAAVAGALLVNKGGPANLPRWLSMGFRKAMQMRVEPAVFERDRQAMRRLVSVKKGAKGAGVKDCWADDETPERILLSASLVDYFVFGKESAKFAKLLGGFRVSDEAPNPTIDTALKAAEWTPEALEKVWKSWVASGK